MNLVSVLKKPVITEKSLQEASKGVFTFEVSVRANKDQIKAAVEHFYGVTVTGIRTVTSNGKRYRVGKSRREVVAATTKKALVSLKSGQKIDLFELNEA